MHHVFPYNKSEFLEIGRSVILTVNTHFILSRFSISSEVFGSCNCYVYDTLSGTIKYTKKTCERNKCIYVLYLQLSFRVAYYGIVLGKLWDKFGSDWVPVIEQQLEDLEFPQSVIDVVKDVTGGTARGLAGNLMCRYKLVFS